MTLSIALALCLPTLQGMTTPDVEPLVVTENLYPVGVVVGTVTAPAGDWNGDGVLDYALGLPEYSPVGGTGGQPLTNTGLVQICSGATGEIIDAWIDTTHVNLLGNSLEPRLGAAIAGPFDTNQNGRDEIAVGLPGVDLVQLLERHASGSIVKVGQFSRPIDFTGQVVWDEFGAVLANLGDVDGDGWDDLGVGAPATRNFVGPIAVPDVGAAVVRSGATLGSLAFLYGSNAQGRFGVSLCGVDDVSGDGRRDVAVGAPGANRVRIFAPGDGSVASGTEVDTLFAPPPAPFETVQGFGSELVDLGNLNGFGPGDLLVEADASTGAFAQPAVKLYALDLSVTGGSVRWSTNILSSGADHAIAAADLDGDGRREALRTLRFAGYDGDLGFFEPVDHVEILDGETGVLVERLPAPGLVGDGVGYGDVTLVGDVDGDGGEDVAVGLPTAGFKGGAIVYGFAVDGNVAPPGTFTVDDPGPVDFTSLALAALVAPEGSVLLAERAVFGSWGDVYVGRGLTILGPDAPIGRLEVDRLTVDRGDGTSIVALTADSVRVLRTQGRVTFADLQSQADPSWVESSADVSFVESSFARVVDPGEEQALPPTLSILFAAAQLVGCTVTGADGPGFSSDGSGGVRVGSEGAGYLFGTDVLGGDGAEGAAKFGIPGGSGGSALVVDGLSTAIVRGNSQTVIRGGQGADFGAGVTDGFDIEGDAPSGNIAFVDPAVPLNDVVGVQFQSGPTPYLLHPGSVAVGSSFDVRVHAGAGLPVYLTITDQPALLDFSLLIEWVPLWVDPDALVTSTILVAAGLGTPVVASFPVPDDPQFIGRTLHLQAFSPQVAGNVFDGTNGNGFVLRD